MFSTKGPASSIEFQDTNDKDEEFDFVCYDCNMTSRNLAESVFQDGHCRLRNALEAMDHLRLHVANGDMVDNKLIQAMRDHLEYQSLVHQSLMSPLRRNDGSQSAKRERAFFEQWLHEQESNARDPMYRALLRSWGIERGTPREVSVMASMAQWLGTNVGMAFLESALQRIGYRIVRDDRKSVDDKPAVG